MTHALIKVPRFFGHSIFVKLWFFPVWLGLGVAKLAIFMFSFKKLAPWLGTADGVVPWLPLIDARQLHRARLIKQVICLAARYTPWDSNCFPQAVLARMMLGLYQVPYCLFFGVRRNSQRSLFDAHAWVSAGRVRVIGGESFNDYVVVGMYVSPQFAKNRGD